jgi:hypothetical protein
MNAHWLFVVFFCCACSIRQRIAPSQLVTSQLAPMDYQVLDWVDSTVCSTYAFSLRMREKKAEDKVTGKRAGILSRGAVLGGRPPDVDSADALYDAMVQLFGTRPIFGRRCSRVETRGVAVGSSPAQTK